MPGSYKFIKEFARLYKLNGEEIQRDELHAIYVGGDKPSIEAVAMALGAEPFDVYLNLLHHHIGVRLADNYFHLQAEELNNNLKAEHEKRIDDEIARKRQEEHDEYWMQAVEIYGKQRPEPTVIMVDGKKFLDHDLVEYYDREVRKIYNDLRGFTKKPKHVETTRCVDLSAMRLHRGLDMYQFSKKSGLPYQHIVYYEKTRGVMVPQQVAELYKKVLQISNSELKKIRECLSGERKSMFEEENRSIPDNVRSYVFQRDQGKCTECGREEYLHYHHIDRYSNGGHHQARNLKLLCVGCHAMEHFGEPGFAMLKAKAEKLGVPLIEGGMRHARRQETAL